jgi:4-hydroxybenzoate polyprenyltransferase
VPFTDLSQNRHWLRLPPKLRACLELARLDRPTGSWLLLFPCFWGLALAGGASAKLYLCFGLGAFVMRGAGCTINDLIDRKLDAQVERTRGRPLPSGRISVFEALLFLALELALGLIILLQLSRPPIEWGAASLLLVVTYPFMKRITWWPQLFLGFTFNWGALLGWVAVRGHIGWPAILLYLGGIAWTLAYDTIYAHQDAVDDARVGIKSTARYFGRGSRWSIAGFYALAYALIALAGRLCELSLLFYMGLITSALYTVWLLQRWDINAPASSLAAFKANRFIGLMLFAAIVFGARCCLPASQNP